MNILDLCNVSYKQGENTILQDINFGMEKGDFISIIGPSGSGKSTLLKLIGDLISPTTGNIKFDGVEYEKINPIDLRGRITYCFQTPYLFGEKVRENMEFVFRVKNEKYDENRVIKLFDSFEMSKDFLDKDCEKLSGGERQRISLIRSIIFRPDIILLDEITSALDAENTRIVEKNINLLHNEEVTIMWITHNQEQGRKYANKILTLDSGKVISLEVIK